MFDDMVQCLRKYSLLYSVFFLLVFYAYYDVTNSGQAGVREGANRTFVYVLLLSIVGIFSCVYFWYKSTSVKCNRLSVILWCILGWELFVDLLLGADINNTLNRSFMCFWWIVTYIFPYHYLKKNQQASKVFLQLSIFMFWVYIFVNMYARFNIKLLFDKDIAISGYIYYILIFIPYILFYCSKFWRVSLLCIAVLMILTSFKRGAILIFPIMLFVYYYSQQQVRGKSMLLQLIRLSFVLICLIVAFVLIDSSTDNLLSARFSQENIANGSGRYDMYSSILEELSERSFVDLFFGTGGDSTLKLLGLNAHNDWLEFLFCYGIIGVLLYLLFVFELIIRYVKLMCQKSDYAIYWGMMITYVFFIGLFGAFYFSHSSFYVFLFLGYLESKKNRNRRFIDKYEYSRAKYKEN